MCCAQRVPCRLCGNQLQLWTSTSECCLATCAVFPCPDGQVADASQATSTSVSVSDCCQDTCALFTCPADYVPNPSCCQQHQSHNRDMLRGHMCHIHMPCKITFRWTSPLPSLPCLLVAAARQGRDPSNCASPVLDTGDSVAVAKTLVPPSNTMEALSWPLRHLDHSDLGQLLPSDMCALCLLDESCCRSSKISSHRSFCVRLLPADVCCFSMPLWLSVRPGCIRLNRRLNGNLLQCNLRNIQLSRRICI